MPEVDWEELDPEAPRVPQARLTLHDAVQLVAAVGQALLPRAEDDAQQSLSVAGPGAWLGAPVAGGTLRAGLDPLSLEVVLADEAGRPLARFSLAGLTLQRGLDLLTAELRRRGVSAALELPHHPADVPTLAASGAPLEAGDPRAHLELARLFADTRALLAATLAPQHPPLRLWPHHFDLACSASIGDRSLGLGVSPGEGAAGRPYWYATPSPALTLEALPALEGGGSWHLDGWTGAELPIERLQGGAAAQRAQVGAFFRSAIAGSSHAAAVRAP